MDTIIKIGIDVILWLQSLGGWLTAPMKFFTFLGYEQFNLLIAPLILWCIDAKLGIRLGLFVLISGMVNNPLKFAFHAPRPYWINPQVKVFGAGDNAFTIPSGHAQHSTVLWGTIAHRINRLCAWIIAIIIILLISISRVYLGVHFPHDILIGWIVGAILLWIFLRFEAPVVNWIRRYSAAVQILFAFLFSLLMITLVLLVLFSLGSWTVPVEWIDQVQLVLPEESPLNPLSIYSILGYPGAFFGLASGWIWLSTQGGFSARGVWWKLILRYLIGLAGMVILYFGLGAVFPKSETLLAYGLRYLRYALIGFWGAGLAPWLFVRLNLANGSHPGN